MIKISIYKKVFIYLFIYFPTNFFQCLRWRVQSVAWKMVPCRSRSCSCDNCLNLSSGRTGTATWALFKTRHRRAPTITANWSPETCKPSSTRSATRNSYQILAKNPTATNCSNTSRTSWTKFPHNCHSEIDWNWLLSFLKSAIKYFDCSREKIDNNLKSWLIFDDFRFF